jgi:hypothetical protein
MDDYITKPLKLSLLLDVASKWIKLSRVSRSVEESIKVHANDKSSGESNGGASSANWMWNSLPSRLHSTSSSEIPKARRQQLLTVALPSKQPVDMVGWLVEST